MKDEKFYMKWLEDNAGKYQIIPDNSVWTTEDGRKVINKYSMSYRGTLVGFTAVFGLKGCIDYFLEMDSK